MIGCYHRDRGQAGDVDAQLCRKRVVYRPLGRIDVNASFGGGFEFLGAHWGFFGGVGTAKRVQARIDIDKTVRAAGQ